jgi:hypothetical protein
MYRCQKSYPLESIKSDILSSSLIPRKLETRCECDHASSSFDFELPFLHLYAEYQLHESHFRHLLPSAFDGLSFVPVE